MNDAVKETFSAQLPVWWRKKRLVIHSFISQKSGSAAKWVTNKLKPTDLHKLKDKFFLKTTAPPWTAREEVHLPAINQRVLWQQNCAESARRARPWDNFSAAAAADFICRYAPQPQQKINNNRRRDKFALRNGRPALQIWHRRRLFSALISHTIQHKWHTQNSRILVSRPPGWFHGRHRFQFFMEAFVKVGILCK
jgi:hypothetical protein